MGCAVCRHPPYDHGCLHLDAHDYQAPSDVQVAARWDLIRAARLGELRMPAWNWVRPTECAPAPVTVAGTETTAPATADQQPVEALPLVPEPRPAEGAEPYHLPVQPVGHRSVALSDPMPAPRPAEPPEARAVRLALAREPLVIRQARIMARRRQEPSPEALPQVTARGPQRRAGAGGTGLATGAGRVRRRAAGARGASGRPAPHRPRGARTTSVAGISGEVPCP
ncbi:hypothetical protein GCM10018955_27380 [Planomonospora venezuelensis]